MSSPEVSVEVANISMENIGGIDETEVILRPGVNALTGRNATNRTSFLQGIMAALGSDDVSLKGDAAEGSVTLTIGEETYTRTLQRRNGTVVANGDPFLDDSELADLFAFLLESNEARRAVARGEDLQELIMRPVDTEAIQDEIDRLSDKKKELEREIDQLSDLKEKLPKLEQRRTELAKEIEEKRTELENVEESLEEADRDVEETREEKESFEETLSELESTRSELEQTRFQLETQRESLEALREERGNIEDERSALEGGSDADLEEIESEILRQQERKRTLDSAISELLGVIEFNERMLEEANETVLGEIDETNDSDSVTDELLPDETVTCWTCGSSVERSGIEATIQQLQDVRREKMDEREDIVSELDELKSRRKEINQTTERRERLQTRLDEIDREIDERTDQIESLEAERDELINEVQSLEEAAREREDQTFDEILDLHREANQLEFELGQLEREQEDVISQIESIEERLADRDDFEARREAVVDELEECRTRIDRIARGAVESFNEHMENVLDALNYENLERIWIERTERNVREGRRTVTKSTFDLHVVRNTETGVAYEDTVDHLSESEREVTGLVFALAGYLVHEVYKEVPFMLLDSLEAIDSDRIATLIEYVHEYAPFLVVALLHEDAAALDDQHRRITDI